MAPTDAMGLAMALLLGSVALLVSGIALLIWVEAVVRFIRGDDDD